MWAEMENNSTALVVVDPNLGERLFRPVQPRNVSAAAASCPSCSEDPLTRSGIIPGAIAATVFIVFLLGLYALLWKCMMSQPQRRKSRMRTRVLQKTPV